MIISLNSLRTRVSHWTSLICCINLSYRTKCRSWNSRRQMALPLPKTSTLRSRIWTRSCLRTWPKLHSCCSNWRRFARFWRVCITWLVWRARRVIQQLISVRNSIRPLRVPARYLHFECTKAAATARWVTFASGRIWTSNITGNR